MLFLTQFKLSVVGSEGLQWVVIVSFNPTKVNKLKKINKKKFSFHNKISQGLVLRVGLDEQSPKWTIVLWLY